MPDDYIGLRGAGLIEFSTEMAVSAQLVLPAQRWQLWRDVFPPRAAKFALSTHLLRLVGSCALVAKLAFCPCGTLAPRYDRHSISGTRSAVCWRKWSRKSTATALALANPTGRSRPAGQCSPCTALPLSVPSPTLRHSHLMEK
jgi:hypothetical protein